MPDTISNIIVPPDTPVDLYVESGVVVGTKINVAMIGGGSSRLVAIATLLGKPDNTTGYRNMESNQEYVNDTGDSGAWIWSATGCTVNVKEVV